MSGGVDSSVSAALLKQQGYEVVGVHLKCYNVDGCAEQDAEDARRAAEVLQIPFYVFNLEQEYKDKVVEYMVAGYRKGITPNPDVMCNKEIKFGLFLKKALEMGADYIATGHYVRVCEVCPADKTTHQVLLAVESEPISLVRNPRSRLGMVRSLSLLNRTARRRGQASKSLDERSGLRQEIRRALYVARDKNKDQSYFLWTLTQEQLRHCLFPIGNYLKPEVRELARKFGLPNAEKKDSQGICFLGQVTLKEFLGNYLPQKKGLVLNTSGTIIGEHDGAYFYTIGQRNGLGIGGNKKPVYVAEKDVKENAILVAEENDPALYRKEIELRNVNLINSELRIKNHELRIPVLARVRYRQPLAKALFIIQDSLFKLIFNKPQKFVASGQSAVMYDSNGKMLGGGVIF